MKNPVITITMDKLYAKLIVAHLNVAQAAYEAVTGNELKEDPEGVIRRIEKHFSYPVFVKPCNAGSSCGISRAADRESLIAGLMISST